MESNYNSQSKAQLESYAEFKGIFENSVNLMIENHITNYSKKPITILDIGCSHGRNSISQVNNILDLIYLKVKEPTTIQVFHEDLEINDFTKLFIELNENPIGYHKKSKDNNIFSFAIGKGFENQLLPKSSVDFMFSFFTIHWAHKDIVQKYHKNSNLNSNSLIVQRESSRSDGYSLFFRNQLKTTLIHRLNELRKGGIFICNFLITDSKRELNDCEDCFRHLKAILLQMENENIITLEEVESICFPIFFLSKNECDEVTNELSKKGLKIIFSQTKSTRINKLSGNSSLEPFNGINVALSAFGQFIKNAFTGNHELKESKYNIFKDRVYSQVLQDQDKFNYPLALVYYCFQKTIK